MAIVREAGIAGDQQWTPTRREWIQVDAIPNAKKP